MALTALVEPKRATVLSSASVKRQVVPTVLSIVAMALPPR
jgi:hypothetical protein